MLNVCFARDEGGGFRLWHIRPGQEGVQLVQGPASSTRPLLAPHYPVIRLTVRDRPAVLYPINGTVHLLKETPEAHIRGLLAQEYNVCPADVELHDFAESARRSTRDHLCFAWIEGRGWVAVERLWRLRIVPLPVPPNPTLLAWTSQYGRALYQAADGSLAEYVEGSRGPRTLTEFDGVGGWRAWSILHNWLLVQRKRTDRIWLLGRPGQNELPLRLSGVSGELRDVVVHHEAAYLIIRRADDSLYNLYVCHIDDNASKTRCHRLVEGAAKVVNAGSQDRQSHAYVVCDPGRSEDNGAICLLRKGKLHRVVPDGVRAEPHQCIRWAQGLLVIRNKRELWELNRATEELRKVWP